MKERQDGEKKRTVSMLTTFLSPLFACLSFGFPFDSTDREIKLHL